MTDIKALMDAMSDASAADRSRYHLTLGELIAELKSYDPTLPVEYDVGGAPGDECSYRGYYRDLGFDVCGEKSVGELLAQATKAYGQVYTGYKGGDFIMDADTPLWLAHYGTTSGSRAMLGIHVTGEKAVILTKRVSDF